MPFKVFVSGVFDNLHPGHLNFFKQAWKISKKGKLIVIISLDENVLKRKKCLPKENQLIRLKKVKNYLDKQGYKNSVVLGYKRKKYSLLEKFKPHIIFLGYDQEIDYRKINSDYIIKKALPYFPEKFKSSLFK